MDRQAGGRSRRAIVMKLPVFFTNTTTFAKHHTYLLALQNLQLVQTIAQP